MRPGRDDERRRQGTLDGQRGAARLRARRHFFGYNDLVADMRVARDFARPRAAPWCSMRRIRCSDPARTARIQGGERRHVPVLARAAVAAALRVCSWKRILRRRSAQRRLEPRGRLGAWARCSRSSRSIDARRQSAAVSRETTG
jgi:hypothetical protein